MLIREFLPHPSLTPLVQWFRICHFEFEKKSPIPVKAYAPKPEMVLHFFLDDFWAVQKADQERTRYSSMVLAGQRTSLMNQFTGHRFLNIQIVFQPTAVTMTTGIPAHQLTNQHYDPTFVFGNAIKSTFSRLQETKNYSQMLSIVQEYCFSLLHTQRTTTNLLGRLTDRMIQHGGNLSVDQLASDSCLCVKQFKRKFYECVGVNPKTYLRIIRFNKAWNLTNAFPTLDKLTIALACGYHDYQHLARDYKEFTGTTPSAFSALERESPESMLGLTKTLYKDRLSLFQYVS